MVAGGYANRVLAGLVHSIAGNQVLVADADLQILQTTWNIDPETSSITGLNMLVTANSSQWEMKLYQVSIQVSCLDPGLDGLEGTTDDVEIACSTSQVNMTMPSRGAGLRLFTASLSPPLDPERVEVSGLSYIVTDLPAPAGPSTIYAGANPETVTLVKGGTVQLTVEVHGTIGVPEGAMVDLFLQNLPTGVSAQFSSASLTLGPGNTALTTLSLQAGSRAMVGTTDVTLGARANLSGVLTPDSMFELNVSFSPDLVSSNGGSPFAGGGTGTPKQT